ncbi:MAG TPA: hypothetical protein VLJ19_08840 [Variovorax sp.]|nr:hypothetical protein [Variovorax sp.]
MQMPMENRMFASFEPHACHLLHFLQCEGGASFMEVALVGSLVLVLVLLMLLAMQSRG